MTSLWSWSDLLNALDLTPSEGPEIHGINIDSRKVQAGELFVAISGRARPEFNIHEASGRDGHSFIDSAVAAGATGVLAHDSVARSVPTLPSQETLDGLWDIARYRREQLECVVVGLTGSSGKTTLKTFLRIALGAFASEGSLNNHLGVPLSMSNTPLDACAALYEIGTNHPGEIMKLSKLVRPDVAVLLNVHPAHIGNFKDIEELRIEKLSITDGLKDSGKFVVPFDLADHSYLRGREFDVITHGSESESDVRFTMMDLSTVEICSENDRVSLPVPGGGEHRAATLCAAAATLGALGEPLGSLNRIHEALPRGRGDETVVANVRVVDESYNANPSSMSEALKTFVRLDGGRKIAVVGTMNELGVESKRFHLDLVPLLSGMDKVICVGEYMEEVFQRLPSEQKWLYAEKPTDSLIDICASELEAGDSVLIKASNSVFWKRDFANKLIIALKNKV